MITFFSLFGAFLALLAYFMVSNEKWEPKSLLYNGVNLLSCLVLGGVAVYTGTAGYILLNVVWGVTALKALIEKARLQSRHKHVILGDT